MTSFRSVMLLAPVRNRGAAHQVLQLGLERTAGGGVGRSLPPSVIHQMHKVGPQESAGLSGGGSFGGVSDKVECQRKGCLGRSRRWRSPPDRDSTRTAWRALWLFAQGLLHQVTRSQGCQASPTTAPRAVTHGGRRGPLKVASDLHTHTTECVNPS